MINYLKYRWFFTSLNKLVIGGKNSSQNDRLIKFLKKTNRDYIMMHTKNPGSPFSVIYSEKKPTSSEIEQCAIFTASFSKEWKEKNKTANVHIFKLSQLYKDSKMKEGTWGIKGLIKNLKVQLFLALTIQKSKLRAVPIKALKKKDILIKLIPGNKEKQLIAPKLIKEIKKAPLEDYLSALPSGGIKIIK